MYHRTIVIVTILLIVLGAVAVAQTDMMEGPLSYEEFLAGIPEWMESNDIPGLSMAVVQNGELLGVYGFGVSDTDSQEPVTENTLFQLGALSKPASGWVILQYFEENDLDINAPITEIIEARALPFEDPWWEQVTMAHLLSHYAGLSGAGYSGFDPSETLPTLNESLTAQPLEFRSEPGTEYYFSSPGYSIAQLIVELHSGEEFSTLAERYFGGPFGMTEATYDQTPSGSLARGHGFYGARMPLYQFPETAAAGLSASAAGLVPWIMAHYAEETTLSPERREQIMTPYDEQGFHTLLYNRQVLPEETVFLASSGANRGFRSYLAFVPESESALLLLTNSDRGHFFIQEVFPAWMGVVAGELITASPMGAFWVWMFTIVLIVAAIISVFFFLKRLPLRLPARPMPFFVLLTTAPLGLSLAWVWFWHTDWLLRTAQGQAHFIPAQFMPKNFWVLSMAIVVFAILQVGFTVLRQVRGKHVPS